MKLYYYKTKIPSKNFGDELNPWLWPQLLPQFDGCGKTVFVGIGTAINNLIPQWVNEANRVIFFSTGVGYGDRHPLDKKKNWQFYCVRGPLSAKRLRLPQRLAVTDGAALLKRFFTPVPAADRLYNFSYMPHFRHGSCSLFQAACQSSGIHYIDPGGEVEKVVADIRQTQVLLSEAMHGAIAADALRVPWIPIRTNPKILPFKWIDWCQSVRLPYRYEVIRGGQSLPWKEHLYPARLYFQGQYSASQLLEGFWMTAFQPQNEGAKERIERLANQLAAITQRPPYLSDESHLETLVVRLEEHLDTLRQDLRKVPYETKAALEC